jgi:hypothetical protein
VQPDDAAYRARLERTRRILAAWGSPALPHKADLTRRVLDRWHETGLALTGSAGTEFTAALVAVGTVLRELGLTEQPGPGPEPPPEAPGP